MAGAVRGLSGLGAAAAPPPGSLQKFLHLLISAAALLLLAGPATPAAAAPQDLATCCARVEVWRRAAEPGPVVTGNENLLPLQERRPLLFFLDIAAGTSGFHFKQCALKHMFTRDEVCSRNMEVLSIDPKSPSCRLVAGPYDYSALGRLPAANATVMAIVKPPVDRVFEMYETLVRAAAAVARCPGGGGAAAGGGGEEDGASWHIHHELTSWPWSMLVPMMKEDMERRAANWRAAGSPQAANAGRGLGLYDAPDVAMPFAEFLRHPEVARQLHNGVTFQLAGLTPVSLDPEAPPVRKCIDAFPEELGHFAAEVAEVRARDTALLAPNEHDAVSMLSFFIARPFGWEKMVASNALPRYKGWHSMAAPKILEEGTELLQVLTMEGKRLGDEHHKCIQADLKRELSIKTCTGIPLAFDSKDRINVTKLFESEIKRLNSLDDELEGVTTKITVSHRNKLDNSVRDSLLGLSSAEMAPMKYAAVLMQPHLDARTSHFLVSSSFRLNASYAVAVGISPHPRRWLSHDEYSCHYESKGGGGRVAGKLKLYFPKEHHDRPYEAMTAMCYLERAPEVDGGDFFATFLGETMAFLKSSTFTEPKSRATVTFCAARPMFGFFNPPRIREWLEYHRVIHKIPSFIFYDAGAIHAGLKAVLDPFINAGLLSLIDTRPLLKFPLHAQGQVHNVNECLWRTRITSDWTIYFDLDEYLWVKPPATLATISEKHKDAAFISFGNILWYVRCYDRNGTDGDGPPLFAVERYLHRRLEATGGSLADGYWGRRKYMLNPRKVKVGQVHGPTVFDGKEALLHAEDDAVLHHYRGLALDPARQNGPLLGLKPCRGGKGERLVYSEAIASLAARARKCPLGKNVEGC